MACVAAGMRPEAVMGEEGKRTRFRKAIKKRAAHDTSAESGDPSSPGEQKLSFGSRLVHKLGWRLGPFSTDVLQ